MRIDFSPGRWENIRETYEQWWEGTLERPILPVILEGRGAIGKQPETPLLTQATCHELHIPAKALIDRIDYELSNNLYLGDAFPYVNLDVFGPGIAAAFLGAELDNSTGRVWYHPREILPVSELHFEYDPENIWLQRIKEICHEAMRFWQGQVLVGMPDLGGILDILSTFRPGENLLLDLYDEPEEVKRLCREIQGLWHRFYRDINEVLQPVNPGYSDWARIYSAKPCYVLQSDFSYMISPQMFDEFTRPYLAEDCRLLPRTLYHLDGVGQLPHLDSLLEIAELGAVQWVPGDGKPGQTHWPEVYQKIHQAGKRIQIWEGFDCLDTIAGQIGTCRGIHQMPIAVPVSHEADVRRRLAAYGVE